MFLCPECDFESERSVRCPQCSIPLVSDAQLPVSDQIESEEKEEEK